MGIGISLPSSSCNEPLLCRSHMALICVPAICGLSLGKIPKISTVPGGNAAKLCAAKAHDWKIKPSSFSFCTRSSK
eukprot:1242748-Pyramimonas_sp.AAC.1